MPLVNLTLATLRNAEFGFFGVMVLTWMQTPRFCGEPLVFTTRLLSWFKPNPRDGDLVFRSTLFRLCRTS
jgi:hypothetical protein